MDNNANKSSLEQLYSMLGMEPPNKSDLTRESKENLKAVYNESASLLYDLYDSLANAGFAKKDALEIVIQLLKASILGKRS